EIYCIYLELKECMRYGEEGTYSRVAKDYKIMELFNKIASNRDDRKCYIATYSPNERNILEEEVNKLGLENGFEVKAIKQINQSMFAKSDATLILPGPLRMKYLSELLRPYKKIIILAYDGENCNIAKDQIDLFYTYSFEQERNSMLYLGEVYEFLGIQKDGLFKDYYDREKTIELKLEQKEVKPITRKEIEERIEVIDRIKKIISINPRYTDYREYEEEVAHIENTMTALDKEQNEKSKSGICYEVSLRKVDNTSLIRKLLPIEKTYLYLEEIDGEVREGIPRNLQPGYFVVILGNDERKTLLEIVLEIFDLEESVDKYLIESWKKRLIEFIEKYDLSYADLYKHYIEKGGKRSYQTVLNWAKGNVLGPDNPIDLLIIGTILEDDEIIEDYNIIDREVRNLRVLHQTTGRKLRKIIKEILKGELDPAKLSYEEYMLYGKIEGGIYEIVDIMKRNSNDGGDR
ncbi:MAG: DrmE family protein, partial [Methanomicrobia archaeon]|nr:DrmE family protein [Methanomicrobia archaeon]